jgi:LysM repeat protein
MVSTYLVQPGDTWTGLAGRFGVSPEALAAANHLACPGGLAPGQPLVVPDVPVELTLEAFPGEGWIPGEAWEEGEAPRSVVVERMWRFRLPLPAVAAGFVDHVVLILQAGPARPRPLGPVTVRLIALNAGPVPLILRYPTAQRAEFVVTSGGREVFRASAGRLYAQQVREVTLAPGQAEVAVEHFVPEASGEYRVTAWNLALAPARLDFVLGVSPHP